MAKIVYNACFGGFGLSHEAILLYGELKGLNLLVISPEDNSGYIQYYTHNQVHDDNVFCVSDIERDDPALVEVVERMGSRAEDTFSKLRIKKLTAGTKYIINEYDGSESVMTIDDFDWKIA